VIGLGIDVSVAGWSNRYPLQVVFARTFSGRSDVASASALIRPGELPAVTVHAMAPGRYVLYAKEDRRDTTLVSDAQSIELSAGSGIATVQLTLKAYDGILRLRAQGGTPITGATVITGDGNSLTAVAAGSYSLAEARPGVSMLIVAAGYVPQCLHAIQSGDQTVLMDKGQTVVLSFESSRRVDASMPIGRLSWPEVECPISLSRFDYRPLRTDDDGSSARFSVTNFPRSSKVWWLGSPISDAIRTELGYPIGGVLRVDLDRVQRQ